MTSPATCCSFCGDRHDVVTHLVKGRTSAMICEACVLAAALTIRTAKRAANGVRAPADAEAAS